MAKGSRAPAWQRALAGWKRKREKLGLYASLYGLGGIEVGRIMGQFPANPVIPRPILDPHGKRFGSKPKGRREGIIGYHAHTIILDDLSLPEPFPEEMVRRVAEAYDRALAKLLLGGD